MKRINLILIIVSIVFVFSCEKDSNESNIRLTVSPDQSSIENSENNNYQFEITITSSESLKNFSIHQSGSDVPVILIDSIISGLSFNCSFFYQIPAVPINVEELILTFKVRDAQNNESKIARRINVKDKTQLLSEYSGNVIHSALSGQLNAFNLELSQALNIALTPDSIIHFEDHSIDSIHGQTLSREWISPMGCKFIRFEGFNYSKSTASMVQNAFYSGVKQDVISQLNEDDIIIIGKDDLALAVIYISQILDQDSTENDKYIFNYKPLLTNLETLLSQK